MGTMERMAELRKQRFFCSQILMILGLELQGKENLDLIRAMQGLAGGLGFTGETCGGLTGGASLLGLYAGRAKAGEDEDLKLNFMIDALVKWFKGGYGQEYGGIRCDEIVGANGQYMGTRCPLIVAGTFQKVKNLLIEYGYDLAGTHDDD